MTRLTTDPPALLAGLDAAARETLMRHAVECHYAPREVIFRSGEDARGMFIVLEGRVRVMRGRGGRQHVAHVETSGGTLGEVPLFAGGGYPATAIAAEPTRCLVLSRAVLAAAIAADPELAFRLLGRLALRVRTLVERLERLTLQDVPSRLAAHILERPRRAGTAVVSLGMTQGELAEELGTVRELVGRALRRFRDRGLVRPLGGNRVEIIDEAGLAAIAEAS
jgi:CRP/FNR family transcriptional regulator, dissimilatory nitrate respiration regulator